MVLWAKFVVKDLWKSFLHRVATQSNGISSLVTQTASLILSYWVTRSNFHPPWCLWSAIPLDALDLWKRVHEYVFGLMGLLISDFTMLNVLQMAPKLTVRLQAACHSKYQCFGETASGYLWLSTSKLLPDSDPAMPNDLEMHVQGVLQRSLNNSESTTTVTPTRIQCKNQDLPLSSMPLTPSNNFIFLVEIQQHHQTKEAKKGVHITSGTKAFRPNIASSDTSEDPITECCLLKQKKLRNHEGCWWQQGEHGFKHRSQSVCSMDKDSWTVFTISSPLKYPEWMQVEIVSTWCCCKGSKLWVVQCVGDLWFTVLNHTGHQEATIGLHWPVYLPHAEQMTLWSVKVQHPAICALWFQ